MPIPTSTPSHKGSFLETSLFGDFSVSYNGGYDVNLGTDIYG